MTASEMEVKVIRERIINVEAVEFAKGQAKSAYSVLANSDEPSESVSLAVTAALSSVIILADAILGVGHKE